MYVCLRVFHAYFRIKSVNMHFINPNGLFQLICDRFVIRCKRVRSNHFCTTLDTLRIGSVRLRGHRRLAGSNQATQRVFKVFLWNSVLLSF